jgi:two-component system phosphate regulon sensor histidine kinase PhoR
MRKAKNSLTITLILISALFLLLFQFFWIRSTYSKAFDDLQKETNMVFRSTVLAMRDSLLQQTVELLPGDSIARRIFVGHRPWDTLRFGGPPPDSAADRSNYRSLTRSQLFRTSSRMGDSLRSRIMTFSNDRDRHNFIMHLALKTDSIEYYFKIALTKGGVNLPFHVLQVKRGERPVPEKGSFVSEPVRINPINRYAVSVSGFRGMLIRQIWPEIFFSVFLTLITLISFYVMYRSIRSQQLLVELKNDFISNMTHELKTPITTVSVAIEALKNFKGMEDPHLTSEYLNIAQNELNRLTLLTDKVLKTAIFEDRGVTFQPEKVDIEKLIRQILDSMKLVFEKNGTSATFETEGHDFTVVGGADHLTNAIYNLLDNALKYSPPKSPISITLKSLNDKISISIQDNGPGIAPEYQKKIFEKFFRVPTGDVHTIKGYGLGLSYVRSVIRSHHGMIEVRSTPGKGSCFIITLPKAAAHEKS